MIDFSAWKHKEFRITSLVFDAKNPRVPASEQTPSERDIIAGLIEHEHIHELARKIADRGGLYPSEKLVVVEEDGEKVVVEGNRRLAALKLLDEPKLAPETKVKYFQSLKERLPSQALEKVAVVIAPSRRAAAPLIADRHTESPIKKWVRIQQARFLRSLIDTEHDIEEVARQLSMTPSEILETLRNDTMLQVALAMPLSKDVREVVQDPRRFNYSILERLLDNAAVQKFLGITFTEDGGIAGAIDEAEFKRGYTRLVSDIAKGAENTRTLNSKEDINRYLTGFGEDTPNRQKKGGFSSESLLAANAESSDQTKKRKVAAPKRTASYATPRDSQRLVPRSFKAKLGSRRIKEIFSELSKLKVSEHPNALAVLLRIFLELLVSDYLDTTGKINELLETTKAKEKGPKWYPTLKQMLAHVLKDPDIKLPPLPRKALNKMLADDDHYLSIDHLDAFVHNRHVLPSERDLRGVWDKLEPLLILLMDATIEAGRSRKASA
ncbi:hypothetical protein P2318_19730 [Myxococcaceae bacterium GXIMD 01537]